MKDRNIELVAKKLLIDYVEGNILPKDFELAMSKMLDDFEIYLNDEIFFDFLLQADYRYISSQKNIFDKICDYLNKHEVKYNKDESLRQRYNKLLKVLPKYLEPTMEVCNYIESEIFAKEPTSLNKEQLNKWLKDKIRQMFPLTPLKGKAPKWLEKPSWPFEDGKPLHFIGQLLAENPEYKTYYYIFENPVTFRQKVIVQQDV